ncbi:hypothetical protein [Duncaniella muris]|uniref:hypothetical protein n=1 Tax=Duncaniella muris TaxID=2094150 RepID=UPI002729FE38|nr:hypothetical protein [Duncaniella muris]
MEIIIITLVFIILNGLIYFFFRQKYVRFTENIEKQIDDFINGDFDKSNINEEQLDSKLSSKLYKLGNIINAKMEKNSQSKKEIQEMVSDIAHQIKTPIANIRMYSDTISNNDLSK